MVEPGVVGTDLVRLGSRILVVLGFVRAFLFWLTQDTEIVRCQYIVGRHFAICNL